MKYAKFLFKGNEIMREVCTKDKDFTGFKAQTEETFHTMRGLVDTLELYDNDKLVGTISDKPYPKHLNNISFKGCLYPAKIVTVDGKDITFATVDLNKALLKNGKYVNREAEVIDNTIFMFMDTVYDLADDNKLKELWRNA